MSSIPHKKTLTIGLGAAVVLAIVAWRVGSGIRSPAQIAADTAAPAPSLITAPVELRTLATEVVVRGTVRYGSPQAVVLAASNLKTGSAIVNRPAKIGSELREGTLAMSTSGRPVFVLRGAEPMHRDLAPGAVGPDVRQLEEGLARIGFSPGSVDDRFDKSTSAAIGAWYRKAGWTPLGATDAQAEQLRVSQAAASAARDAVLQAKLTLQTASRGATAADISQARIDASAASDAVATATLDVTSARNKAAAAKDAAARARQTASLAQITGKRDAALAAADLASKQTALKAATDAQADAQFRVDHPPADTRAADLEALKSALRQATAAVPVARSLVDAKKSAQAAAEAALAAVVAGDAAALAKAQSDVSLAKSEVASAEAALASAIDAQADAQRRVDNPPTDTRAVEVEAAKITLRQATAAVPIAQNDVAAATQAVAAAKAAASAAAAQARSDARAAARDSGQAAAELLRARKALTSTRARSALAKGRVTILSGGGNTAVARQIVSAAESEANRTRGALNTLAARLDIQMPADELLFFPALPLRVDAVSLKRGDLITGKVMTVSNSALAADSSLSLNDAKLVRVGAPATIEEQDLGIKATGKVTKVADKPGTNKVDPTRVYFEVTPKDAPARLVGASVRIAIAVQSTKGAVLAVPLSALSVGADGRTRVQVDRGGERGEYVAVIPGLASDGLVEVKPTGGGTLKAGDLVVVGVGGAVPASSATGGAAAGGATTSTSTTPSTSGTSTEPAPSAGTTTEAATGTGTGGSTP